MFNGSKTMASLSSPKTILVNFRGTNRQLIHPTKTASWLQRNLVIGSMKGNKANNTSTRYQALQPQSGTIEPFQPTTIENRRQLPNNESLAPRIDQKEVSNESTLGRYLARRLVHIGVKDVFGVPGDSNLNLLDQLIAEPELSFIGCCNELNAGYAADGYARSVGVGACAFTFTVGGLSALNAIAGAYSENLPVICIIGGPNSNYYAKNVTLHHTIGLKDFSQELKCFEPVTCYQALVNNLEDAQEQIDTAIKAAISQRKPVYIHISSNLASIPHPSFSMNPIPLFFNPRISNLLSLEAAVEAAIGILNKAAKPVLIGGARLKASKALETFADLVDACGYATAVMPAAKGMLPENHPQYIGTYWGPLSSPHCAEIVESADVCVYVGPIFDDLSSLGYSTLMNKGKMIVVHPERVVIGNDFSFGSIFMNDFLRELSKRVRYCNNNTSYDQKHKLMYVQEEAPLSPRLSNKVLQVDFIFKHIQKMLSGDSALIADTGDSWFRCQKLQLPQGCGYEVQMHYASIGWSVGATLGYAQAAPHKRVIACIGDGSFQMTAQEVSTMLRCGQRSIIILINNGGYSTEIPISDGAYNEIKTWGYANLVNAIDNGEGKCWVAKVQHEDELTAALNMAMGEKKECFCFIEVIVDKNDTSEDLIKLGSRLAAVNSSPPCT